MRGCGSGAYISHQLQDVQGGVAHGGDFLALPNTVVIGSGTSRTNKRAAHAINVSRKQTTERSAEQRLKSAELNINNINNNNDSESKSESEKSKKIEETMEGEHNASRDPRELMNVTVIELDPESPPLTDLVSFAGQKTLIVQESPFGMHAVEQIIAKVTNLPWQVLRIEPTCHIISHMCGLNDVYDVLCDEDYALSMDRIGECGLNPFPVDWSEPRKLGISMRSVCLIGRFTRGALHGGGGVQHRMGHLYTKPNYHATGKGNNRPRMFTEGKRIHNDIGAPLFSEIACGEIPTPVFQHVPRYKPPMHKRGSLVVQHQKDNNNSSNTSNDNN